MDGSSNWPSAPNAAARIATVADSTCVARSRSNPTDASILELAQEVEHRQAIRFGSVTVSSNGRALSIAGRLPARRPGGSKSCRRDHDQPV